MRPAAMVALGLVILMGLLVAVWLPMRAREAQEARTEAELAWERARAGMDLAEVDGLLDRFHGAASRADLEGYFGCLTGDALFVGTDPTEAWSVEEFRAYAEPYFAEGRGWTYRSVERRLSFLSPDTACFYEQLDNEKYGLVRGSGTLVRGSEGWRIAQYVMSFPVPNDVTPALLEAIREAEQATD